MAGAEYRGYVPNGTPAITGAVAKYLKNGQPVLLTDGSTIAEVSDIVVVKR